jgi:hypothetical protein
MPKTNQTANPQVPIRLIWTPGTRYHKRDKPGRVDRNSVN